MAAKFRKNIAGAISDVDLPEVYPLNRWLREPNHKNIELENLFVHLSDTSYVKLNMNPAEVAYIAYFEEGTSKGIVTYSFFPTPRTSAPFFKFNKADIYSEEFSSLKATYHDYKKLGIIDLPKIHTLNEKLFELPKLFPVNLGKFISETNEINLMKPKVEKVHSEENFFFVSEEETSKIDFRISVDSSKIEFNIPVDLHKIEFKIPVSFESLEFGFLVSTEAIQIDMESKVHQVGFDFDVKTYSLDLDKSSVKILKVSTEFQEPTTEELSSKFIPEIQKINLLTEEDILDSENLVQESSSINDVVLEKVPLENIYETVSLTNDFPMMMYQNFDFEKIKYYSIQNLNFVQPNYENDLPDLISKSAIDREQSNLKNLLEPTFELPVEIKDEILAQLSDYQREGAEFLYHHHFAMHNDCFELMKEVQALKAMKMLLKSRAIKKALIITNKYKASTGFSNSNNLTQSIWQHYLGKTFPDMETNLVKEIKDFDIKSLKSQIISIVTDEVLETMVRKRDITIQDLGRFDCIVFDNLIVGQNESKLLNIIGKNLNFKYIWYLNDCKNQFAEESYSKAFPHFELQKFGRDIEAVKGKLPLRNSFDCFMELDKSNIDTADVIEEKGKLDLDNLLEVGNLLRFQPNVFRILHDIQSGTNFIKDSNSGNKAKLLKYHLQSILTAHDRLLVYSQFNKNGLVQVEEILENLKIKYFKFTITDNEEDVKRKLKEANNFEKVVFLTNLKPKSIKFKFHEVYQIINFDNWWNPLTRWSLESKLENSKCKCISVYNYYYKDTLEFKLIKDLDQKGLRDYNVVANIPTEGFYRIYDESDWCKLFEIKNSIFQSKVDYKLNISTLHEIAEKSEIFLNKLGYKNVLRSDNPKSNLSILNASANQKSDENELVVFSIFAQHIGEKYLNKILPDIRSLSRETKILIITNGTIDTQTQLIPTNVSIIDGDLFKNYIDIFINQ